MTNHCSIQRWHFSHPWLSLGLGAIALPLSLNCIFTPGALAARYRVSIVAGQSNAVGSGTQGQLWQNRDSTGDREVALFYRIALNGTCFATGNAYDSNGEWVELAPQTAATPCNPFYNAPNATGFGPELSLGRTLTPHLRDRVAIVKFAVGATQLVDTDGWRVGGRLHDRLLAFVETATATLTEAGHTVEIAGLFWMQGESDAARYPNAIRYQTALAHFIASIRSWSDRPHLPVVLGQIYPPDRDPAADYRAIVRDAQHKVAASDPFVALVETRDLDRAEGDAIHYSSTGQVELGRRFGRSYLDLVVRSRSRRRDNLLE